MTSVLLKRVGRLWMTSAWLCALCVVVGDQPRLCTRRGWRGRSATKLPTGISTSRAVTGGLAVAKVFWRLWCLSRRSALGPLPNAGGEFLDVVEDFASFGHFREDLLLRVHHGCVVAAEGLPDLRERQVGQLAA